MYPYEGTDKKRTMENGSQAKYDTSSDHIPLPPLPLSVFILRDSLPGLTEAALQQTNKKKPTKGYATVARYDVQDGQGIKRRREVPKLDLYFVVLTPVS